MKRVFGLAGIVAAGLLAACGDTPRIRSSGDIQLTHEQSVAALHEFQDADPTLQSLLDKSVAYAVFPRIVSAAIVFGGAHGEGEVYQGGRVIGYADASLGSFGAQLGGQKSSELVIFMKEGPWVDFRHGTFEFSAQASAVAASKGAAATADYSKGVVVFTQADSGLMASAAIGAQKFRYQPAVP